MVEQLNMYNSEKLIQEKVWSLKIKHFLKIQRTVHIQNLKVTVKDLQPIVLSKKKETFSHSSWLTFVSTTTSASPSSDAELPLSISFSGESSCTHSGASSTFSLSSTS